MSTKAATRKALLNAADALEKNGWVRGSLAKIEGPSCAVGGLAKALGWEPKFDGSYMTNGADAYTVVKNSEAGKLVADALPKEYRAVGFADDSIWVWNDDEGRTASEVIAKFREVAESILTPEEEAKLLLIEAAHILERDGWTKGEPFSWKGQECCVLGAIARAGGIERDEHNLRESNDAVYAYVAGNLAVKTLARTISPGGNAGWVTVFIFNDTVAENKWQVIAKLYEAAASIEVGK